MKKFLKILGFFLLAIILLLVIGFFIVNKKLPTGTEGEQAENLAQKMLSAIDKPAWDTTHVISFSFRGEHNHLWDKKRHFAQTEWENYKAIFDVNTVQGKVWENGSEITDATKADELIKKAWHFFLNDSYWLNPVAKMYDPGVSRKLVKTDNGENALLVSYSSGGITPGDSYLWILDEKGLPKSWQMWVNIIPIGGLETSWEEWITLPTGAKIATKHQLPIGDMGIPISNVKAGTDWISYGMEDPFVVLE